MNPTLTALRLADPPGSWEALGFAITQNELHVDGITVHLGASTAALGIRNLPHATDSIDGLATTAESRTPSFPQPPSPPHPNGVTGIDHVVIVSPDFDRTAAALTAAGMPLRRIRDAGTFRQGFRRLGPAILELAEATQMPPGPAQFWGLTFIAQDLDALAAKLDDRLKPIKPAVQPGRRIATLDKAAGLATNVAFMSPEPPRRARRWRSTSGPPRATN
jgi:hypothetical protein